MAPALGPRAPPHVPVCQLWGGFQGFATLERLSAAALPVHRLVQCSSWWCHCLVLAHYPMPLLPPFPSIHVNGLSLRFQSTGNQTSKTRGSPGVLVPDSSSIQYIVLGFHLAASASA